MSSVLLGTAGHIDHGKSALVLALTGTDPDRLKEEQARGITIDLGFAHWTTGDLTFSFVDVPGHERFVKNMLAGVGGIDAVVLVIAADESVMPQTREHFEICRLLAVRDGIVAITKSDVADADTIELVRMEARELLAGSSLAGIPIVALSSKTGEGLDEFRQALVDLARRVRPRDAAGAVRLPIDRSFSVRGFGTVVTGTLLSGRVRADDELIALPGGRRVKVRGVQVHGQKESVGAAGQRVALNLGGIDLADIGRGDSLLTPETLAPTRMLDARLQVVPLVRSLRHGTRVRFHQGTSEILGRVALASVLTDRGVGEGDDLAPRSPGAEVLAGGEAYVRLRLESPAVLSRGDRFILRAYSPPITMAGGLVLDPHPARGPIRTTAARRRFERLDPVDDSPEVAADRAVATMVAESGASGFPVSDLVRRAGLAPDAIAAAVNRLTRLGTAARAGDVLVTPGILVALGDRLLSLLGDFHKADPLAEGMPREEVRERVFAKAGAGIFERVVDDLQRAARIVGRDRLALASHRIALSRQEQQARAAIDDSYRVAGLRPPEPQAVAAALAVGADVAERMTNLLVRQKVLVKLDTILFHVDALDTLRRDLAALRASAEPGQARIDVATFKERYGVSRKYAIPLLEYLDRERVTRRTGEWRVII